MQLARIVPILILIFLFGVLFGFSKGGCARRYAQQVALPPTIAPEEIEFSRRADVLAQIRLKFRARGFSWARAEVGPKGFTLRGDAPDAEVKSAAMEVARELVTDDALFDRVSVAGVAPEPAEDEADAGIANAGNADGADADVANIQGANVPGDGGRADNAVAENANAGNNVSASDAAEIVDAGSGPDAAPAKPAEAMAAGGVETLPVEGALGDAGDADSSKPSSDDGGKGRALAVADVKRAVDSNPDDVAALVEEAAAEVGSINPTDRTDAGADALQAVRDCQQRFDRILSDESIQFTSSSAGIDQRSFDLLNRLAEVQKSCPDARIEIEGHTDRTGSQSLNQRLSEKRARAVMRYLVGEGVPDEQLTAKGYGELQPKVSNDTPQGRAINRRIELKVSSR